MQPLTSCLCCDGDLVEVLDLGVTPLANNYRVRQKFPLRVNRCTRCFHLQLSGSVDPKILFSNYPYFSGTSETAKTFFREFAQTVRLWHPAARTVLDIASNDGSQLDAFATKNFKTFGVDPSENLSEVARSKGHKVTTDFLENYPENKTFDIITAQNVLAHTPTPLAFLKKCRALMHDESSLFVTTSHTNMVMDGEFDSIYHEHLSYFNSLSLGELAARAELHIAYIATNPIHGGSLVTCFKKTPCKHAVTDRVHYEKERGLYRPGTYKAWAMQVNNKVKLIRRMIRQLQDESYVIVGCGAAAKGISLLNVARIQPDFFIDTTPAKQGHKACGAVIHPFEFLREQNKKLALLILAWNFEPEVRKTILAHRDDPDDLFLVLK